MEKVSSRFRKQRISDFYYAWSTAAADINRDGILDVVAPPFYYLGTDSPSRGKSCRPDLRPEYAVHRAHDRLRPRLHRGWLAGRPEHQSNGRAMDLYVNPKGESRRWDKYKVTQALGQKLVSVRHRRERKAGCSICEPGSRIGLPPDPANPTAPWTMTEVSGPVERLTPTGSEQAISTATGAWTWCRRTVGGSSHRRAHRQGPGNSMRQTAAGAPAQMSVYDVNGDGLNDVVTRLKAHRWGISSSDQKRDSGGSIYSSST